MLEESKLAKKNQNQPVSFVPFPALSVSLTVDAYICDVAPTAK